MRQTMHYLGLLLALSLPLLSQAQPAAHDPLISLKLLFSPASVAAVELSPNGKMITFVAPLDGVQNIFVSPVGDPSARRAVTHYKDRGVQVYDVSGNVNYHWTGDDSRIIYLRDHEGDENWNVYSVDLQGGEPKNLTPIDHTQVRILAMSLDRPLEALIGINDRDPKFHDPYRLNLITGERQLVEKNTRFAAYVADNDLKLRIAVETVKDGGANLYKSQGDGQWERGSSVTMEDLAMLSAIGFDATNTILYSSDSRGRNTAALVGFNLKTGKTDVLAEDNKVDIDVANVMRTPKTHRIQAYATSFKRTDWHVLDKSIQPDIAALAKIADGDWKVESQSADGALWIVEFTLSDAPKTLYLYDRKTRIAKKLFVTTPQLEGLPLTKLYPLVIKSRDGFDMVSYISIPRWEDQDGNGRPRSPLPTVMLVHGGPSDERPEYGFFPLVQWLANRGYAVFIANFRGSPGFGKAFMNAQNLEWGGKMNDDLIDQASWLVANKIARKDKFAILGGSYGGYATLVAMTFSPDVFSCGVDVVGPANLETFMDTLPPYFSRENLARRVGDPQTKEGRELLRARSPINRIDQLKKPLLIGQGAHDVRVPQGEADRLVEALKKNGVKVTYLLYPDEGHGFLRSENDFSFFSVSEVFLGECLGGRYEPIGDLTGSSMQVPFGAQYIPGLEEALSRNARQNAPKE
jgi:dipeptidyl aminopeptidase/acylaminoacyl peptidase